MSALPRPIFAVSATPDWRRTVPIGIAASKLGVNSSHLTRQCNDSLQSQGFAHFGKHPDGGQPQWFISRDYDARLIDGPVGRDWQEPDLSECSARQREKALQKRSCVESYNFAVVNGAGPTTPIVKRLVEELQSQFPDLGVSRSSLYSWIKMYRRPADTLKLIDTRGGNRLARASAEAWEAFRGFYLHENRPSIRQCWRETARASAEKGWEWCGLDACRAHLKEHVTSEEASFHRCPMVWRERLSPFIMQAPESWRAGETSIGDHKQLDLICSWGETIIRPWVTAWMDWRTRKITGWVMTDSPNSSTILAALRHALMDPSNMGGPKNVWIDNGRDYDAWMFHGQTKGQRRARINPKVDSAAAAGILLQLQIDAHFSTPFNPNGKARLERWFRTLESFCRTVETYTGDSIESKPERLNEIIAARKLIPTFDEVYERIKSHIAGYNANADHGMDDLSEGGQTLSPEEAYARWCDTRRVMADPNALDLLLQHWHKPMTVGRNGVTISIRGQSLHYGYCQTELSRFKGLKKSDRPPVRVAFDPHNLSSIQIYDNEFRYVCTAAMNQLGGLHGTDAISVNTVKELSRQKAQYRKALKHTAENSITSVLTNEERLAHLAATPKPEAAQQPSSLQIVRTSLDGQGKEKARQELKIAVGAEALSPREEIARRFRENLRKNSRTVAMAEFELNHDALDLVARRRNAEQ